MIGNGLLKTSSIWPGLVIIGAVSLVAVVVVVPKLASLRDPALLPLFGMLAFILATLHAIITVRVIPSESTAQSSRFMHS